MKNETITITYGELVDYAEYSDALPGPCAAVEVVAYLLEHGWVVTSREVRNGRRVEVWEPGEESEKEE